MPRKPRYTHQSTFFHVIVQGIEKRFIFPSHHFISYYFNLLNKTINNKNVFPDFEQMPKLIAYCIMNNHAHFLLKSEPQQLSKLMHRVNLKYAQFYNDKLERVGYVFRNRFLSEPITDQNYLLNCTAYIHQNPIKAHLVRNCEDYRYSSYHDYLTDTGIATKENKEILFYDSQNYLSQFIQIHQRKHLFLDIDLTSNETLAFLLQEFNKKYPTCTFEKLKYDTEILILFLSFISSYPTYSHITHTQIADFLNITVNHIKYCSQLTKRRKNNLSLE